MVPLPHLVGWVRGRTGRPVSRFARGSMGEILNPHVNIGELNVILWCRANEAQWQSTFAEDLSTFNPLPKARRLAGR